MSASSAPQPEAFSRILIDRALSDSGWDLLNPQQVRFELQGNGGRADYVLCGPRGPICVLEAKREDEDSYNAKDQARGYAENLHAPFIILFNASRIRLDDFFNSLLHQAFQENTL